ncbi:MAG: helix-turn-helix transcriptional regulator [Betaproteobacteria bacterium]|nr:helix-turn-helix transcriptional regulator [Betaproteobacteria bacterium]
MSSPISTPTQAALAIAARRKTLKLSQRDVASRLGISQARLSELESDPSRITLERLISLAGILGLELVLQNRPTSAAHTEW